MLGLAVMFVVIIYLLISIGAVCFAVRKAKERDIAGWKWGLPAGLVMYLLVFWDHVPTLVAHNYYCGKEAGFIVYKTIDEWKEENPSIVETLVSYKGQKMRIDGNETIFDLNQRFIWSSIKDKIFLSLKRNDNRIVDKNTNEILARYIDFSTGYGNFVVSAIDFRAYKSWLNIEACEKGGAGDDTLYSNNLERDEDNQKDILKGGKGKDIYYVGDTDELEDSDRDVQFIEFGGVIVGGIYEQQEDGSYKNLDNEKLILDIAGNDAVISLEQGATTTSFTIKNFKDEGMEFKDGDFGITLNDTPPSEPLEFFGTDNEDFIIDTDVDPETGDYIGAHIINNIPGGEDKQFTSPVQRVEGRGGDDVIDFNADIANIVIYGDSAGVNPELDGDDFIRVDRINSFEDNIPEDLSGGAVIHGEGGDDFISGGQRSDILYGDADHDEINGRYGNDLLVGGTGNDLLEGNEGRDVLNAGEDNDRLFGGEDDDVMSGFEGNDHLYGDTIAFNVGWDGVAETYQVATTFWNDPNQQGQAIQTFDLLDDVAISEHAIDVMYGGSGDDQLYGGGENDNLYGEADNDHLEGEAGDDQLFGGTGNDVIWGDISPETYDNNTAFIESLTQVYETHTAKFRLRSYAYAKDVAGNDILDGGAGYDQLQGGGGNDTYVLGFDYDTDVVIDSGGSADKIKFASGITEAQIDVSSLGVDVLVTLLDETGQYNSQLILTDWAGEGKIESIEFADGTIWDEATIESMANPAADGGEPVDAYFILSDVDDVAQGQDINEAIYGLGGSDLIQAGGGSDRAYLGLSEGKEERMRYYKHYINRDIPEEETQMISRALQLGQLTGSTRFVEEVEQRLGVRIEHRGQGRPKKLKIGEANHV